jgi:hypothetical protein
VNEETQGWILVALDVLALGWAWWFYRGKPIQRLGVILGAAALGVAVTHGILLKK